MPTLSFYFNAPSIALFGNTIFALRFPWTLVGAATILVTFLLVSRLKGPGLGLLTAALLTTYHFHIHFSRLGSIRSLTPSSWPWPCCSSTEATTGADLSTGPSAASWWD